MKIYEASLSRSDSGLDVHDGISVMRNSALGLKPYFLFDISDPAPVSDSLMDPQMSSWNIPITVNTLTHINMLVIACERAGSIF